MRTYSRGERDPAVVVIRDRLSRWRERHSGGPPAGVHPAGDPDVYDDQLVAAVRAFQQERGLLVDGIVGPETWRALEESGWRLGDRLLRYGVNHPYVGDDVAQLQRRLLELGFDAGRCDGVFRAQTEAALEDFQRNYGLRADGICGPATLRALRQLQRSVVGGSPAQLRESEALAGRGPSLAGKSVVLDPGHGGSDLGWVVDGVCERDLASDLAARLEGRLLAAGLAVFLTHGPRSSPSDAERAEFANSTGADVLLSLHTDGWTSPAACGVATYHYGTGRDGGSATGQLLAELIQREIVARSAFCDARTHAKTWTLLRRTQMPAVRVELGYLTNPSDRSLLLSPAVRETVAEAILVAVARLYLPAALDPPTGELRLPA